MDEDKLFAAVERGGRAHREYEETQKAFDKLDAHYTELWRTTADPAVRERIWLTVQVLTKVRKIIISVIKDGEFAESKLETIEADTRKLDGIV